MNVMLTESDIYTFFSILENGFCDSYCKWESFVYQSGETLTTKKLKMWNKLGIKMLQTFLTVFVD